MKRLLSLLFAIIVVTACTQKIEEEKYGEIAGVVYDNSVGEPISVAQIKLSPGGNSTVTGTDGSFSFTNIEAGNYTVSVTKKGYSDGSNTVTVIAGRKSECNILIDRIPAFVTADKAILDFGDNNTLNTLSFNIVNSSYENLSWHIDYDKSSSSFITEVSPESGTTQYGKTAAIIVKIDREKLKAGQNESTIVVVSDNGDGSSEVKIKAIGQEKSKATLNITGVTDITSSTAIVHGKITFVGSPTYTERGFVYAKTENPTFEVSIEKVTASVTDDVNFSYMLKDLSLGVKYYVRAFAVNSIGIAYSSNQEIFTPVATLPILSVSSPDHIDASRKTATLHGSVDYEGDPAYSEKGFVYVEGRKTPTISDSYVKVSGTGMGSFDASISGLKLGSTYCVRSYAKNEGGVSYSEKTVEFTISGTPPTVSVGEVTDINLSKFSAILHGNLESVGSPAATEKGFVYSSVNKTPTENDIIVKVSGVDAGSYYASISQLELGKTYYVRAYARNEEGIVYSLKTTSFSTNPTAPSITMRSVTNVNLGKKTAILHGSVETLGDPAYNEKGFVYSSTNDTPTISDSYVEVGGSGIGTYETTVSNLILGKKYYVRAYAINAAGTSYSSTVVDFSTIPTPATVSMRSVTNINREKQTALFQGTIVSTGDPAYYEKGFVYSTTNNKPTINDNCIQVKGSDIGNYEITATGLNLAKYYVRAYATNEAGTAYSDDVVSFEISGTSPIVSVSEASDINLSTLSAILNGYVSDVGYPAITERGFVYSFNNSSPTINDSKVTATGASGGSFSVKISNLILDKTYYVKSYVRNSEGLYYSSNTSTFSTGTTLPTLSISQPTEINTIELTAKVSGSIDDAGNPAYTEKGFVYGYANSLPTIENDNKITVDGNRTGSFSGTLTNLVLGKNYYVRAYAKNAKGTAYSKAVSFDYNQILPEVVTDNVTDYNLNSKQAILHGHITKVGNPAYSERGFVVSTEDNKPSINDKKIIVAGSGTGSFEYRITDISTTKVTYARAYAINNKGVTYGETVVVFDPSFYESEDYYILMTDGIAVQKNDIGKGVWESINDGCKSSRVGSYKDWRLPSRKELSIIYQYRNNISGLNVDPKSDGAVRYEYCYWSGDVTDNMGLYSPTYWWVYYRSSSEIASSSTIFESLNGRCVRTLNK